jgi:uncharacterized protein YndB with AHSA1/START domain
VTGPLRFVLDVDCSVEHAFTVWTEGIATWWPSDHTVTGGPGLLVVLEPRLGGRIFERTAAGDEHDWGEVTIWEPPARLAYRWFLRADRSDATDVSIDFVATEAARTRVEITHSGWERLGTRAGVWRERNHQGWSTLLPHYRSAL